MSVFAQGRRQGCSKYLGFSPKTAELKIGLTVDEDLHQTV